MFAYSDPTATGSLEASGALNNFRVTLDQQYAEFGRLPGSAFVPLEAFAELPAGKTPAQATVTWPAFPKTAEGVPLDEIDNSRADRQDEYVEWWVERSAGKITRITFTTEFPEYYEALAAVSSDALIAEVKRIIPGAAPTIEELFGPGASPSIITPRARASRFRLTLPNNPWNNGQKGILCLFQRFNTLGALFNLVGECSIPQLAVSADAVCRSTNGACGPGRNSDPRISLAVQNLARGRNGLSLTDPAGVFLEHLGGIWKVAGTPVDINDPQSAKAVWTLSRNARRGVLDLTKDVTLDDAEVTSGAQVSSSLNAAATVSFAPENDLPAWARTGAEGSRSIG